MSEWKPIGTAPKNGATVLVFDSYQTTKDGRQSGDDGYAIVCARFDATAQRWQIHSRMGVNIFCVKPTHWMPLPPLPEGEAA